MLTHDATLVLYSLSQGGEQSVEQLEQVCGDRLAGTVSAALENLVEAELAQQLSDSKLYIASISFKKLSSEAAPQNNLKTSRSSLQKLPTVAAVQALVRRTTDRRNFHGNYQAVVDGKKARRCPIQTFAQGLSRLNQVDFFKEVQGLNDDQLDDLRRRLSRHAFAGSGNRTTASRRPATGSTGSVLARHET
jgi:hypothetical protein